MAWDASNGPAHDSSVHGGLMTWALQGRSSSSVSKLLQGGGNDTEAPAARASRHEQHRVSICEQALREARQSRGSGAHGDGVALPGSASQRHAAISENEPPVTPARDKYAQARKSVIRSSTNVHYVRASPDGTAEGPRSMFGYAYPMPGNAPNSVQEGADDVTVGAGADPGGAALRAALAAAAKETPLSQILQQRPQRVFFASAFAAAAVFTDDGAAPERQASGRSSTAGARWSTSLGPGASGGVPAPGRAARQSSSRPAAAPAGFRRTSAAAHDVPNFSHSGEPPLRDSRDLILRWRVPHHLRLARLLPNSSGAPLQYDPFSF